MRRRSASARMPCQLTTDAPAGASTRGCTRRKSRSPAWMTFARSKKITASPLVCPGPKYRTCTFSLPKSTRPGVPERRIRNDGRRGRRGARCGRLRGRLLGHPALPGDAVLVGEDALHHGAEGAIAAGVVAVVMGVDQQLDALGRPLFEPCDADLGGRHELAVDSDRAVAVHEISDGSAVAGEVADPAADFFEPGHGGGLCRRCRRLARQSCATADRLATPIAPRDNTDPVTNSRRFMLTADS